MGHGSAAGIVSETPSVPARWGRDHTPQHNTPHQYIRSSAQERAKSRIHKNA